MTPPPQERGFTLVEVMVALLIFGMLAAAGVAILRFSVRAQALTGARLDELSDLNRTGSIMAADLAQALNRPARDGGGVLMPAFNGEAGTLSLVRGGWSNLDGSPRSSEQKVQYALTDGAWRRTAYPTVDGAAPLDPAPLVAHVRAVRLRYRFRGAWSDRWDGAGGAPIPDAVEMVLVRESGATYRQMFVAGTGYAAPIGPGPTPTATPTGTPGAGR